MFCLYDIRNEQTVARVATTFAMSDGGATQVHYRAHAKCMISTHPYLITSLRHKLNLIGRNAYN